MEQKWIPVEERLPEDSLNSVLGWDTYRERCCFVRFTNGRFVLGDDTDTVNIIAWMPAPAPPPYQPQFTAPLEPHWKDRMMNTFLGGR